MCNCLCFSCRVVSQCCQISASPHPPLQPPPKITETRGTSHCHQISPTATFTAIFLCFAGQKTPDFLLKMLCVRDGASRINSWESWFSFNLWEKAPNNITNQIPWTQEIATRYTNTWHYKTTIHIITVHTWTAVFLKHLPNTSFMASSYEHASCCHAQPSILLFIATVQVSHLAPSAIWVPSH